MFERGENLPLFPKTPQNVIGVHAAFDQFDGDFFIKFPVVAHRRVNRSHAAAPDFRFDAIRAQSIANDGVVGVFIGVQQSRQKRFFFVRVGFGRVGVSFGFVKLNEELFDFRAQSFV